MNRVVNSRLGARANGRGLVLPALKSRWEATEAALLGALYVGLLPLAARASTIVLGINGDAQVGSNYIDFGQYPNGPPHTPAPGYGSFEVSLVNGGVSRGPCAREAPSSRGGRNQPSASKSRKALSKAEISPLRAIAWFVRLLLARPRCARLTAPPGHVPFQAVAGVGRGEERRRAAPARPKPISNIAQVAGSGTAEFRVATRPVPRLQ